MIKYSCTICYENYEFGDYVKQLNCNHEYHVECIDPWLVNEKRCPMCNAEIDTQQLATKDEL
jgi:hypothetical protein